MESRKITYVDQRLCKRQTLVVRQGLLLSSSTINSSPVSFDFIVLGVNTHFTIQLLHKNGIFNKVRDVLQGHIFHKLSAPFAL